MLFCVQCGTWYASTEHHNHQLSDSTAAEGPDLRLAGCDCSVKFPPARWATAEEVRETRLVVEGNKFTLTGKGYSIAGTFTIDPSQTPRAIDVRLTSNDRPAVRFRGIYQTQGDRRKSCFSLSDKRPTRFAPKEGCFGFEWQRD